NEAAFDDRAADEAFAYFHEPSGVQHRHQGRAAGAGGRAVELAGLDDAGIAAREMAVDFFQRAGDEREGEMVPAGKGWVSEAKLLVSGGDDLPAGDGNVAGLVR